MASPRDYMIAPPNLAAVDAARQQRTMGQQSIRQNEQALKMGDAELQEYERTRNRQSEFEDAKWLAASTGVLKDLAKTNPQAYSQLAEQVTMEGIQRGLLDPSSTSDDLDPTELEVMHNRAIASLRSLAPNGAQAIDPAMFGRTNSRPGSLQELDAINADRRLRGQPPLSPEDWLRTKQTSSGDIAEYRLIQDQAVARGEAPPTFEQYQQRKAERTARARATGTASVEGSPVQQAIDKRFATNIYVPFMAEGGYADVEKSVAQLNGVVDELETTNGLSGWQYMFAPDWLQVAFTPEALDVRQQVEEIVQRNLRLVLGAQFTEKEGERLIARAYDQRLPQEVNAERVRRLLTQIESAAMAQREAVKYFQTYETLRGYEGDTRWIRMTKEQGEDALLKGVEDYTGEQQTAPQPKYREGQTATNPDTGERLIFRNGKWVPYE